MIYTEKILLKDEIQKTQIQAYGKVKNLRESLIQKLEHHKKIKDIFYIPIT